MWFASTVFLALRLFAAADNSAQIFEYSYKIPPLTEEKVFGSPTVNFQGDYVQIWKLSTQPNAALGLFCDINIPETKDCAYGSLMFSVSGHGRTYCGKTTAYYNYVGNIITVIYRKQYQGSEMPLDYFRCKADARIITKYGPVTYRPRPITHSLPKIDDTYYGVSPGTLTTTCPCGWTNKRVSKFNTGGRLVGGEEYAIHEYPFIVQLFSVASKHPFCAGTILSTHHVLTAAHCTIDYQNSPHRLGIGAGTYDNSVSSPSTLQLTTARQIIVHEEFQVSEFGLVHDIAILVVRTPFRVNMAVGPACFPGSDWDLTGHRIRVLGWGAKAYKLRMSSKPQEVDMVVIDQLTCSYEWGNVSPINRTQLCTQARNKSTCHGDSGGPVIWLDPETNRYTIIGIVSYGPDCGDRRSSIQTDVSAHLSWIYRWIEYKRS